MSKSFNTSNFDRATRQAIRELEAKTDRNTGGMLLGKHMVHKSRRAYNRRDFKRWE